MSLPTLPGQFGPQRDIPEPLLGRIAAKIAEHESELIAFRRRLHSEPELSFREVATTDALMERLMLEGLNPVRLESGTGLYCDINPAGMESVAINPADMKTAAINAVGVKSDAPMVAIRAEIDALALDDVKDVPYRSRNSGVAHACGHDVHTSAALGAGIALSALARSGELPGCVRLIFEPGEESVPVGSVEIVEAGLLGPVDMIYALHCDPRQDVGQVGSRVGPITSAYDRIALTITGPGGHTARPERTVDLVSVAADVARRLPAVLADRLGGPGACRFVFGSFHSGSASNVIPTTAVLGASLRSQDVDTWRRFPDELPKAIFEVLGETGAHWELDHVRGVPPVVNDPEALGVMAASARHFVGPDLVNETEHSWGGDSFGWMTEVTAGAFLRLGTHRPDTAERLDLHNARFDVDERCIAIGAKILAGSAVIGLNRTGVWD